MRAVRSSRRKGGACDVSDCNVPAGLRGKSASRASVIALTLASAPLSLPADAEEVAELHSQARFCSATAQALSRACGNQVDDDYWVAFAICINESDAADRKECFADAQQTRGEDRQLCREQLVGRRNTCGAIGEARYDPEFEAAQFDANFAHLSNPNRYFPLGACNLPSSNLPSSPRTRGSI